MRLAIVGGSREAAQVAASVPGAAVLDPADLPPAIDADAIIDARHPFETADLHQMTAVPPKAAILRLRRAPWRGEPADRWRNVPDAEAAFAALGPAESRVFLCLGEAERGPFTADPVRWYLVRTRAPRVLPPDSALTEKAGPFSPEEEAALMSAHKIDVLVTRNAGGQGAYPKVAAARTLGLPVILLTMPESAGPEVQSVEEALAWFDSLPSR